MTDNFEQFKFYEGTPQRSNKQSSSSFLRQCRSVIRQLHTELTKTVNQLDLKNHQLSQLTKEKDQLDKQNTILQNNLQEATKTIRENNRNNQSLKKEFNECRNIISYKEEQIQKMKKQMMLMESKFTKLEKTNKINLQTIQQLKKKISLIEQTVQITSQENNRLSNVVCQKQQDENWQIQQLRQYNEELRKKFQLFEENISHKEQYSYHDSPLLYHSKPTRALSTDRKKNVSYESTFARQTSKANRIEKNPTSFISHFSPNPQIGKQLQSLKQQISRQYTKIQVKKQGFNHQRVNKTLAQLERKIGKLVSEVERTDSQSCIE